MTEPRTIDCTPTWAGVLVPLLAVIQDGTAEGRRLAIVELRRMAALADAANALAPALRGVVGHVEPMARAAGMGFSCYGAELIAAREALAKLDEVGK
jgi:hypothetical protein